MVILSYIYSFLIAFTLFGIILSFFYHRAFLLTCSYACKEILHDERLLNDEAKLIFIVLNTTVLLWLYWFVENIWGFVLKPT